MSGDAESKLPSRNVRDDPIGRKVAQFYTDLPFNYFATAEANARHVASSDLVAANYPILTSLLHDNVRVLDVGCGSGTLVNALRYWHNVHAVGIDVSETALRQALAAAKILQLQSTFSLADLFLYSAPKRRPDIVTCVGVLHHTADLEGGVSRICRRYVAPSGHVVLGLYNKIARDPMSDHFEGMKARGAAQGELWAEFVRLHSHKENIDKVRMWSRFRDQILHPYESRYTVDEIASVLERSGMAVVGAQFDGVGAVESLAEARRVEAELRDLGQSELTAGRFFPGLFLVAARG